MVAPSIKIRISEKNLLVGIHLRQVAHSKFGKFEGVALAKSLRVTSFKLRISKLRIDPNTPCCEVHSNLVTKLLISISRTHIVPNTTASHLSFLAHFHLDLPQISKIDGKGPIAASRYLLLHQGSWMHSILLFLDQSEHRRKLRLSYPYNHRANV